MSLLSKQQILAILDNPKLELSEVQFSDEMIGRFQEFCSILQKWNEKINLTSEKNALSILEKHIFDSLQYLRWLDSSQKTLDIGSGGGFPGIPVKIIYPDLDLTLLESQRKRCNFLREVIRSLKLEKIDVAEGRGEKFSSQEAFSEKFDRVLFRGFSSYGSCLAIGLPFLKSNGKIILKKGPDEIPDPARQTFKNARVVESKEVAGFEGQSSLMVVVEKCST
jgi:16S rRNA (guanine527-N7)-methyltransferase